MDNKLMYESPTIETIEVVVERGFANSNVDEDPDFNGEIPEMG